MEHLSVLRKVGYLQGGSGLHFKEEVPVDPYGMWKYGWEETI